MKRLYTLLLAGLLLTGCAETDSEDPMDAPASEGSAPAAVDTDQLSRPDALNPVNEVLAYPLGWQVRLDRPNPEVVIGADTTGTDVYFANMTPGWHFKTTEPRVILYHPASTAEGEYTVSSIIHLFTPGRRNEAYGLIFGGKNLDADDQEYLYFVIRRSGEFLLKKRLGDDTEVIHDWTSHDAIVPFPEDSDEVTAKNTLSIEVGAETVKFFINEAQVLEVPAADLDTDGLVGFRMNHGVEAHIESLDVTMAM